MIESVAGAHYRKQVVANLGSAVVFGSIFWKLGLGQSYINDRVGLLQVRNPTLLLLLSITRLGDGEGRGGGVGVRVFVQCFSAIYRSRCCWVVVVVVVVIVCCLLLGDKLLGLGRTRKGIKQI